jgi:hypothetical protein
MSDLWYKDAVFYELYVRAFFDSNSDGHGDLRGVIEKLDYLVNLGVDCIWLLPLYPSPLKDDGYDIADFYGVLSEYGTLEDFKTLVQEAHRRGLRVIADLVLIPGSRRRASAAARPTAPITSGATATKNTLKRASFSSILRLPTGAGMTRPANISGTAFTPPNPT